MPSAILPHATDELPSTSDEILALRVLIFQMVSLLCLLPVELLLTSWSPAGI